MTGQTERDRPVAPNGHHAGCDDDALVVEARANERLEFGRILLVVLAAASVWFRVGEPFVNVNAIGFAAALAGGYPIIREALENLIARRMTMELSMTIALVAALSIGQIFTALVIMAFVLAAEVLEGRTVARGREAIGDLLRYLPQTVRVRRGVAIADIAAADLVLGDAVLVDPGALLPVDGVVIAGHSFVDEARITGEAMPARKAAGAAAFAGTLNGSGALEIRAQRLGRDTSFGRIVKAVESAQRSRAPIERLADRLAGWLVGFALGAAALTFAMTRNIVATIAVVIVAGACGVAAGTPLAVLGAIGRAARAGAIVKGGRYLEALAKTQIVVFDKTGTVTFGAPDVRAVLPAAGISLQTLLELAAIAESRSEHPLGRAIVAHARSLGITAAEPDAFEYTPGRGICAQRGAADILVGNAALLCAQGVVVPEMAEGPGNIAQVFVAHDGRFVGTIEIADALRPEAVAAIAQLRAMSIRTVLLTGDVRRVADAVAQTLGIDDVVAGLLPEEKRAHIAALVQAGKTVVMVGDGVNDAPALIAATVGVALGSGTDVARESADVVLIGNDLMRLVDTVRIARRTKTIVMQNFAGTLIVDALGIALAAGGLLSPLLATFVHVGSELAFILNSTRMLVPRTRSANDRRRSAIIGHR